MSTDLFTLYVTCSHVNVEIQVKVSSICIAKKLLFVMAESPQQ